MPAVGGVLLDKPADRTSFETLSPVKRVFETKKVGHTGTLDRFATGLLVAMIGGATRLSALVTDQPKTYEFDIVLGRQTDTLDPTGTIVRHGRVPTEQELRTVLPEFIGEIQQVPPSYSAVHVSGKRASDRVRAGEVPVLDARPVRIYELAMDGTHNETASMRVVCGKGTYVRSLARDLAAAVGSVGYVGRLRRTRIGPFSVEQAVAPDELRSPEHLLELRGLLGSLEGVGLAYLKNEYVDRVRNGVPLRESFLREGLPEAPVVGIVSPVGDVVAVVEVTESTLKYRAVFS
jgi:tRNA pseudouridine55 synthase